MKIDRKKFSAEIFCWPNFFSAEKCFGRKNFGRKIFRPKKFSAENLFGRNFFGRKRFGRTIFRPKFFSAEKFAVRIAEGGSNGGGPAGGGGPPGSVRESLPPMLSTENDCFYKGVKFLEPYHLHLLVQL